LKIGHELPGDLDPGARPKYPGKLSPTGAAAKHHKRTLRSKLPRSSRLGFAIFSGFSATPLYFRSESRFYTLPWRKLVAVCPLRDSAEAINMKKLLIACIAATAFCGAPALAADMAMKAPPLVAPAAPSWTGFYVGLDGGYARGNGNLLGDTTDNPCCLARPSGGFGGGFAGYDYQMNQFLAGIETDFQGAGLSKTNNDLNFGDAMRTKTDWFGSVRGRLGLLPSPTFLLYVTGGFAYGDVESSVAGPVLNGSPFNIDRTAKGSTLGGGAEYKFAPNFTARVEYQHIDWGRNVPTNAAGVAYDNPIFVSRFANSNRFDTMRFGVSYLFGSH
jgi:outer membrane immunogenic protein